MAGIGGMGGGFFHLAASGMKTQIKEKDKEENIDTSDIPEAGEEFFKKAKLVLSKKIKRSHQP